MAQPELTVDPENPAGDDLQAVARTLFHLHPGWNIRIHGELDSAMAEARRQTMRMGGDAWARLIATDYQFAGEATRGREWMAPRESSVLGAVMVPLGILKIPRDLAPLASACWLLEGLDRIHPGGFRVRWPNDLLLGEKKVGAVFCGVSAAALVIGIAVNVTQGEQQLPSVPLGHPKPTSLHADSSGDGRISRTSAMLTVFSSFLENLEHTPPQEWVLARFRETCVTLGSERAFVDGRGERLQGRATDIDETGCLVVETSEGLRAPVSPWPVKE